MDTSLVEHYAQLLGSVANEYASQTTYLKHPRATPAAIFSIVTELIYLSITFDSWIHSNFEYPSIQSELQGLANFFNNKTFNSTTLKSDPKIKFIIAEDLRVKAPEWKSILQARFQIMLDQDTPMPANLFADPEL